MLRIGIIGLGTISVIHKVAVDLSEYGEIVAVCDINPEKKWEDSPTFYTSIEEMLQAEQLDCVHICLPHDLHVPTILLCAKHGVHVFTEKPVALHYKEATTLFGLEEKYQVKIGVCLQNRYNKTVVTLKRILEEEEFGRFIGAKGIVTWCRRMDYYTEAPWRGEKVHSGGGVMINQAIHTLDLLSYLVEDFKEVESKVANFSLPETDIEDTVMSRLSYATTGTALFFATIAYEDNSSVELEFIFEEAKFTLRGGKLYKTVQGETQLLCEDQKLKGAKHYYGASHCDAIDGFYQGILQDTTEYVSVKEATRSLKVMDAIFASSADNQRKVLD